MDNYFHDQVIFGERLFLRQSGMWVWEIYRGGLLWQFIEMSFMPDHARSLPNRALKFPILVGFYYAQWSRSGTLRIKRTKRDAYDQCYRSVVDNYFHNQVIFGERYFLRQSGMGFGKCAVVAYYGNLLKCHLCPNMPDGYRTGH